MFLSRSTHLALQIDRYYLEHHECTQSSGAIFGGATTFRTLLVQFEKIVRFARHGPMHLHRRNHFGTGRSFGRISRGSLDFGIFCFQTSVTSGGMPSAYGESEARASCGVRE